MALPQILLLYLEPMLALLLQCREQGGWPHLPAYVFRLIPALFAHYSSSGKDPALGMHQRLRYSNTCMPFPASSPIS